jgi:hypothetical protein
VISRSVAEERRRLDVGFMEIWRAVRPVKAATVSNQISLIKYPKETIMRIALGWGN